MQPVDAVWSKMPRVVRDLAKTCGRLVRLEMDGRETELDRSVLEGAPTYDGEDLTAWEDPNFGRRIDDYYGEHRI